MKDENFDKILKVAKWYIIGLFSLALFFLILMTTIAIVGGIVGYLSI